MNKNSVNFHENNNTFFYILGHQVISKNGFIFIIGGEMVRQNERKGTPSASVFCLDSRLNLLTELAPMKSARVHFSATEVDGKIYVFGGRNETGILRDCEVLEIRSNTWSKIRSLLKVRHIFFKLTRYGRKII